MAMNCSIDQVECPMVKTVSISAPGRSFEVVCLLRRSRRDLHQRERGLGLAVIVNEEAEVEL